MPATIAFRSGPHPRACAHRGGAAEFPENTVFAFERAVSRGIRYIETDLHLTRDGVLVCHHDPDVDRTTDGRGPIAWKSLAELRSLDAGCRFSVDGERYPYAGLGIRIPTLEEALAVHPELRFTLELKPTGARIARAVVDFIDAHRAHDRVVVASFHEPTLRIVRELAGSRIRTSAGQSLILRFWLLSRLGLDRLARFPQHSMHVPPHHEGLSVIDRRFIDAARRAGIEIHAWTIDDPPEMRRLLDLGVDAIMSDKPELLLDVLRERGE